MKERKELKKVKERKDGKKAKIERKTVKSEGKERK